MLPNTLCDINILRNPGYIDFVVPDILRAVCIGGKDHRLFISYKRSDSQPLAEQLYDAFSHVGFQVFLDSYRIPPGRAFSNVLFEELIDKGMVVIIESQNVFQSPWTIKEVGFAYSYRLGLVALQMPSSSKFFSMIPSSERYTPSSQYWDSSMNLLTNTGCENFVDFVRLCYARQVTKRRLYLENLLRIALVSEKLTIHLQSNGVSYVKGGNRPGRNQKDYAIHLSSKPPQLTDFRRIQTAVTGISTPTCPILFGPHGLLPFEKREDLQWLASTLGVKLQKEGNAIRSARLIANGRL